MKLNKFLAYKLEAVSGKLFIRLFTPIIFIPSTELILPDSENADVSCSSCPIDSVAQKIMSLFKRK